MAEATIPAPWPIITNGDYHRRRPGEPIGYEPAEGDRIRYALRHTRWCPAVSRMVDGHDERAEFGDAVTVIGVYEQDGRTHYACKDATGDRSYITRDWWLIERVFEDGALW